MRITIKRQVEHIWNNKYSSCGLNGYIIQFIKSIDSQYILGLTASDGLFEGSQDEYKKHDAAGVALGILCSRTPFCVPQKLIYLPLDDDIFQFGLKHVLERDIPSIDTLTWDNRKPIAFWRGAHSLCTHLRRSIVRELNGYPDANVKFVKTPWSSSNEWTDPNEYNTLYDERTCGHGRPVPLEEHLEYKYILIIDGCIIASSLQMIFGTGSVPILVTDPENEWWFKSLLIPWVNYVPARTDNIKEVIEYIRKNDIVARNIALEACEFALRVFSPEYQKEYVKNSILNLERN